MDSFVSAYCKDKDAVVTNRAQMLILWESLRKFMLEWVVTQKKDLDLGFVTIFALPVRRNWLEALNARYNRSHYNRDVKCQNLTAFDRKTGTIRWDIVALASPQFHESILKMESFTNHGRRYNSHVRDLLNEHNDRIHEIFKAYVAETAYPNFAVQGRSTSFKRKHDALAGGESPVESPDGDGGVLEASGQTDVAAQDASVPLVRDLQPEPENVRDGGRDVDEPKDWVELAYRLRMLDATESQTKSERVACGSTERTDGPLLAETSQ